MKREDCSDLSLDRVNFGKRRKEPMILIPSTRLGSYRLSRSGQNVGEKMNKEH